MCAWLSEVYIQANSSADLDCMVNCDTGGGGNSDIFFIYLCEYIICAFLAVPKDTGL
jgi:hypothetical protein